MSSDGAPAASTSSASSVAILIVDDDRGKRLAISSILEPLGHTIVEAESGEDALRAVLKLTFAVILMDVQMPLMDGYETASLIRLRRECEHTPIIFITAQDSERSNVLKAYASGAVDFVSAPFGAEILRAKVKIFVDLFIKSHELEILLGEVTDLSEQSRGTEAQTRSVLDHVADGIITIGDAGAIESFNRAACELFGYSEQEAIGRPFSIMIAPTHPHDFANDEEAKSQLLTRRGRSDGTAVALGRHRNGSTFPVELGLSDVQLGDRSIHIACVRDVSERERHIAALQHHALHDDLTGLPNRELFADRVDHGVKTAARTQVSSAVLVLDLDEFKQVNDLLGHHVGDSLLRLVAERLTCCLRDGDTVARLGGDEFGILLLSETDLAGAGTVAWKLQTAFDLPFVVEGNTIDVRPSIGIALFPEHGDNLDDLLRRADLAMYQAKRSGDGYAVFALDQEEGPKRRLALLGDLRHCIERDELVLHYQPLIDLRTQRTVGVEALLRWNHPSGRLFMPGEFMPEVERSELILPITRWVIRAALTALKQWRDDGYDLTMAVNLGARCTVPGAGLLEEAAGLMTAWAIPAEKLTFELTERALVDTATPGVLSQLEQQGQRLSIDDFGTGYSSLVYLRRLPVSEIKADRSFVTSLSSVTENAVIVRSIIDLAHNLSLRVVAEGVEDETTMNELISFGCDIAQGYYFSRPLPHDELLRWLEASPHGLTRPAALPALPVG